MLKIRLKRTGRKKKPFYKIVLMKDRSRRDGKAIFDFGFYDPLQKLIKLDYANLIHYLSSGAYPTPTVRQLISKMIKGKKKDVE